MAINTDTNGRPAPPKSTASPSHKIDVPTLTWYIPLPLPGSLGGSPSLPSQDKRADRQGEALAVFACPGATACEGVRRYLVEP